MNTNIWMVALTAIYVSATITICWINWKTIQEMREDRRTHAAVTLYSERRDVLESFVNHDYGSIAGDVAILFGVEYFLKMDAIAHREKQTLSNEEKIKLDSERNKLFTEMAEITKVESITI